VLAGGKETKVTNFEEVVRQDMLEKADDERFDR